MPIVLKTQGYIIQIMLRAGLFSLGASVLTAFLMMATIKPFAPGDILPCTFWALVLALGMALISPASARLFSRLPLLINYGLAIVMGGIIGFVFSLCLYSTFFNPYFGTFSIPVMFAWILGGASGLITVAGTNSKNGKGNKLIETVVVVVLCLVVGLMSDKFILRLDNERKADIVWIRWFPDKNAVVLDPNLFLYIPQEELARLQDLDLIGHLQWFKGKLETIGGDKAPISHMIIIMQEQIMDPIELRLPADDDVVLIYIQDKNEWRMDPPDAALLEQSLRLEVNPDRPSQVIATIKVPGGTDRFGAIDWAFPTPNFKEQK
jgi:hypothetical protein